jgi:tetratricopeptide (TPR) repeat protein
VDKISFRLNELKANAPEAAYVLTGQYYFFMGNNSKATMYLDRALRKNEHNLNALCVKGWCNMEQEQSIRSFDYILEHSGD